MKKYITILRNMISGTKISDVLTPFYGLYIYTIVILKSWYRYGRNHHAPLLPYKEIQVHSKKITKKSKGIEINPTEEIYTHVIGGKWDEELYHFDTFCPSPSIYLRYNDNQPWENTPLYNQTINKLNESCPDTNITKPNTKSINSYTSNFDNIKQLDEHCKSIDKLHESINENGYKSCREHSPLHKSLRWFRRDNIQVNIGRNGDIIHKDGKHRLAICKTIGVKKIPVMVVVRHKCWQKIRDEVYTANEKSDLSQKAMKHLYHPDVKYLHDW